MAHDPYDTSSNARRRGIVRLYGASLSSITDGLSQTAFFSERVKGDLSDDVYDPWRDRLLTPGSGAGTPNELMASCTRAFSTGFHFSHDGTNWSVTDDEQTLYTHVLTPNSRIPDCRVAGTPVAAARSWHRGVVSVGFGDGSCRFVSAQIDINIWRAHATPDAADRVDRPFWRYIPGIPRRYN
ncbi:MAG: hypothetical protein B7Z55_19685 [Planctomycetales bacterium 12-60-4]|nr:MAG: hypothetical protein B7Z55_19685 [Planctomycetales bacterium 12-60-4]